MAIQNVSITLDSSLLERLNKLVEEAERKRSWLIAKAIEMYLEEVEDLRAAKKRLSDKRLTPTQLRKAIGV